MIDIITTKKLFPLGQVVSTPNALRTLEPEVIAEALQRHTRGDWGNLCEDDIVQNDLALDQGLRLFSAYGEGSNQFWIITEADRSATTILLPQDY